MSSSPLPEAQASNSLMKVLPVVLSGRMVPLMVSVPLPPGPMFASVPAQAFAPVPSQVTRVIDRLPSALVVTLLPVGLIWSNRSEKE